VLGRDPLRIAEKLGDLGQRPVRLSDLLVDLVDEVPVRLPPTVRPSACCPVLPGSLKSGG
jgi:hypothetical protein